MRLVCLFSFLLLSASLFSKPNIVIIYADDLGYGDLGCYGHPTIRTPHLDRMASEGMRFTSFYSAAEVCTPSRAALLTGRYPIRSGMCHDQFRVLRNKSTGHLPHDEITLAEALKKEGYATGCIGKWHLGVWSNNIEGHPGKHGFDSFFGLPHSNDMDPVAGVAPKGAPGRADQDPKWWNAPLYRDLELIERPADQTTLTRRYTEEAVKFIDRKRNAPFFLYFPHTFPHVPLFTSDKFKSSPRGLYGDVVEELDWSVGQVLEAIRKAGIAENTFVFFSSDNGPWLIQNQQGGTAGLLREGKGSTWEGGMRVPGIAWWPGKIKAGSIQRDMAVTMDLFTTCLKFAGATAPNDRDVDGVDISETLLSGVPSPRKTLFYYRGAQLFAVRKGPWKMHVQTQAAYGQPKPERHDPPLLYHLEHDTSERFDVAKDHPEVIADLLKDMDAHRATVKKAPSQLTEVVAQ
jgi:arylsulfatase A-like enzyme